MTRFQKRIQNVPIVLDGGWATEFQRRGLAIGEVPDPWNLSRPDDVSAVARSYVEAGAQAILTNTFQASPIALARIGRETDARRINEEGARISRQAAGDLLVFGSIGPSGWRAGGPDRGRAVALQVEALANGGVDAVVLETAVDLDEAREAAAAAIAVGLPVVASFYFQDMGGGPTTLDGAEPEEVAASMAELGVDALGANCGDGPSGFVEVCRRLAVSGLPIWIKPNAGLPTIADGRATYAADPQTLAVAVAALIDVGASFVGGCCGTTPAFVTALRREVDARSLSHDSSQT